MKINLKNTSPYRDDDLRAIVQAACKATGVRCKTLGLSVTQRRDSESSFHGGRATCSPGNRRWIRAHMQLSLPRPGLATVKETVLVAVHEAMHLAGATHTTMTDAQRYCTGPLPTWAEGLELRVKEQAPPEELKAAARADRLEHAEAMHKRALTRLRRAETIEKKWKRRLAAMQRAAERTISE